MPRKQGKLSPSSNPLTELAQRVSPCPTPLCKPDVSRLYDLQNCRPINRTHILDRILARVGKDQLNDFLMTNDPIGEIQHGFLDYRSCTSCHFDIFDFVTKYQREIDHFNHLPRQDQGVWWLAQGTIVAKSQIQRFSRSTILLVNLLSLWRPSSRRYQQKPPPTRTNH